MRGLKTSRGIVVKIGTMTGFPCPGCNKAVAKTRWRPAASSKRENSRASAADALSRFAREQKERHDAAVAARRDARLVQVATRPACLPRIDASTPSSPSAAVAVAPLGAGVAARINLQVPDLREAVVGLDLEDPETTPTKRKRNVQRHRYTDEALAAERIVDDADALDAWDAVEHAELLRDLLDLIGVA
jgi:hypothetical protein